MADEPRWAVVYDSRTGSWYYGSWSSDIVERVHPPQEIGPRFNESDLAAKTCRALNRASIHPNDDKEDA